MEKIRHGLVSGIATAGLISVLSIGLASYNLRAEEQKEQSEQTEILYPGAGSIAPCIPQLGCNPTQPVTGAKIISPDSSIYYCLLPLICSDEKYFREPSPDDSDKGTGVIRRAPPKIRKQYLILKEIKKI